MTGSSPETVYDEHGLPLPPWNVVAQMDCGSLRELTVPAAEPFPGTLYCYGCKEVHAVARTAPWQPLRTSPRRRAPQCPTCHGVDSHAVDCPVHVAQVRASRLNYGGPEHSWTLTFQEGEVCHWRCSVHPGESKTTFDGRG